MVEFKNKKYFTHAFAGEHRCSNILCFNRPSRNSIRIFASSSLLAVFVVGVLIGVMVATGRKFTCTPTSAIDGDSFSWPTMLADVLEDSEEFFYFFLKWIIHKPSPMKKDWPLLRVWLLSAFPLPYLSTNARIFVLNWLCQSLCIRLSSECFKVSVTNAVNSSVNSSAKSIGLVHLRLIK